MSTGFRSCRGALPPPLVEQDLVILQIGGSHGACVVAFDKKTGQERWTSLDDPTSYASPIVVEQAGRRVLVCWTGANIAGLDPTSGTLLWRYPFAHEKGWIDPITTPVWAGNRLFVSCPQDGAIMLKLVSDEAKIEGPSGSSMGRVAVAPRVFIPRSPLPSSSANTCTAATLMDACDAWTSTRGSRSGKTAPRRHKRTGLPPTWSATATKPGSSTIVVS